MTSNKELINHLIVSGVLKTPRVIKAFKECDRKFFIPDDFIHDAYTDAPLPIGNGQTISQPWTVAFMLELLNAREGDKVLDIGSGSGWTTALLSSIVGKSGHVLALERVEELVLLGRENLKKLEIQNCSVEKAENTLGKPGEKFDAILVSASAREIPVELFGQLNIGAKAVIPVKNSIYSFEKISESRIKEKEYSGFVFVPLIY